MRKPVNVSKALLLVGIHLFIVALLSSCITESQAFVIPNLYHARSLESRPMIASKQSRIKSSRGSSNHNNNNNHNNNGGRNGGGGGGGRADPNIPGDDSFERPNNHQRIPWLLLGTSLLSKTLEENQACHAAAALSVSTIVPAASSSNISWQRVLSIMFLLVHALRVNAVQVVSTGVKQSMTWYLLQLSNHPVVTKAITAGVVGFFGDYLAQWLEYSLGRHGQGSDDQQFIPQRLLIHGTYEFRRGLGILVHGIIVTGPLMHWGYGLFEQIIPTTAVGGRSLAAITHVLADSTVLDGIFIASTYLVTGMMEGINRDELLYQFRKDYFPSLKASVAASVTLAPLEFAYFRFLPVPLRPLFMNLNDIVWDAVISFMAHRSRHHHV